MADLEYDEYTSEHDYAYEPNHALVDKARRWVHICGAVCSVGLVLGLAVWGYKLAMRDVTGIPVMRAVAGAMRIAPADPGGEQALNQGLTVNAIAAMGTSAALPDQITLAPEAVTLRASDAPVVPAAAAQSAEVQSAAAQIVATQTATIPTATIQTAASPTTQPAAPQPDAAIDPSVPADVAAAVQDVALSVPGAMRQSLRPQPRPSDVLAPVIPTKVQTVSSQPAREIDPATVARGTRLAQLGAFETPELARTKFSDLQGEFGDLMKGKAMVIQSAQSGGHTFYRLRAFGFDTDEDTRRFCAAFAAENADCIPVAQR